MASTSERIRKMREEGLISPRQAELLADSLDRGESTSAAEAGRPVTERRKGRATALVVAVAGLALVAGAMLVWLGSGEPGGPAGPAPVQDVASTINQPGGVGEMNRSLMLGLVVIFAAAIPIGLLLWSYNGLVSREEQVLEAWGQVESNLQRRADLTPRLVESVARYLRHEGETLTAVTALRAGDSRDLERIIDDLAEAANASARALEAQPDPTGDEAALQRLAAAERRTGQSIAALLATAEAYPQLRSSDQFLELQAQLEGTENRLNVARMRFNEEVGSYNAAIRRIPGAFVAGLGRFQRKAYFQTAPDARDAPQLEFD